jgi:hypothetical protein
MILVVTDSHTKLRACFAAHQIDYISEDEASMRTEIGPESTPKLRIAKERPAGGCFLHFPGYTNRSPMHVTADFDDLCITWDEAFRKKVLDREGLSNDDGQGKV